VDEIFDRLGQLFKSWVAPDSDSARHSSWNRSDLDDPDVQAGMDEINDFLSSDPEAKAREKARAETRARQEEEARTAHASSFAGRGYGRPSGPPADVIEAYNTLGLAPGAGRAEIKAAYKKLLMQYHPDRNSDTPEKLKMATDISARINAAYQRIETWTGKGI